ncbi:MAG: hypothetical protein D6698_15775 [Gammaproteobacteria bacterium]|nr:MAG: hypothetical protein D6698_15775 [Gammaproteobacteria bacterium]
MQSFPSDIVFYRRHWRRNLSAVCTIGGLLILVTISPPGVQNFAVGLYLCIGIAGSILIRGETIDKVMLTLLTVILVSGYLWWANRWSIEVGEGVTIFFFFAAFASLAGVVIAEGVRWIMSRPDHDA